MNPVKYETRMISLITFYSSLFAGTLLAATILPFSSEVIFISYILMGYDPFFCILIASLGNCSGVTINYFIGRSGLTYLLQKLNFDQKMRDYYHMKFERYDKYLLLAAWTPVFGDPITIYAGVVKTRFPVFASFVYTGRIARYILIYLLIDKSVQSNHSFTKYLIEFLAR
jgi:membrane protein YqaA with SNARE-associated domain